jgi:hypothetical protein
MNNNWNWNPYSFMQNGGGRGRGPGPGVPGGDGGWSHTPPGGGGGTSGQGTYGGQSGPAGQMPNNPGNPPGTVGTQINPRQNPNGGHQPPQGDAPGPGGGGQYSWNPFGQYNSNWNNPTYGTGGYNASWHPDFGEQGVTGFYGSLAYEGTDDAMLAQQAQATNQYTQMLANSILSGGYMNPYAQDVYHQTLSPTLNYGEDQLAGAYNDNTAQMFNSSDYWNGLEGNLNSYLSSTFGADFTDQTAGANDRVEQMNDWLQDVIAMGRQYASDDPSQYYSSARRRDRDRAWNMMMGRAESMGLDPEFYNLGANLWGQNMGTGTDDFNPMNTGAFSQGQGRGRNSTYN